MEPASSNPQEDVWPPPRDAADPNWGDTVVRRLWDHASRGAALPAPATEPTEPTEPVPAVTTEPVPAVTTEPVPAVLTEPMPALTTEPTTLADPTKLPAAVEHDPAPRLAELEQQVRDVESLRGTEVGDLQRAQADLANTQVELVHTTKKLREAEDRLRVLERVVVDAGLAIDGPAQAAPPSRDRMPASVVATTLAPEPSHEASDDVWSGPSPAELSATATLMERLASLRAELLPPDPARAPEPSPDPKPDPEPAAAPSFLEDDAPDAGSSLRDRLTRAAAARHRTSS